MRDRITRRQIEANYLAAVHRAAHLIVQAQFPGVQLPTDPIDEVNSGPPRTPPGLYKRFISLLRGPDLNEFGRQCAEIIHPMPSRGQGVAALNHDFRALLFDRAYPARREVIRPGGDA